MARKPKIRFTVIDKKEKGGCHYAHKIGDTFDFDTERGKLCPMAVHAGFPYIDILRYGGVVPGGANENECKFCCPDADVIMVFRIEKMLE